MKMVLILMCLANISWSVEYPAVKVYTDATEMVQVEKCWSDQVCTPAHTYPLSIFKFDWKKRRNRAIATGSVEALSIAATTFMAGWIGYGSSDTKVVLQMLTAAGFEFGAVLAWKAVNPFYQWKLSRLEKALTQEALRNAPLFFECNNKREMTQVVDMISKILQ